MTRPLPIAPDLLDALMDLLAHDACQRAEVEPLDRGYREDEDAMWALRLLLAAMVQP